MNTVRTVATLRATLAPDRPAGRSIGLVPTMGYLHAVSYTHLRAHET